MASIAPSATHNAYAQEGRPWLSMSLMGGSKQTSAMDGSFKTKTVQLARARRYLERALVADPSDRRVRRKPSLIFPNRLPCRRHRMVRTVVVKITLRLKTRGAAASKQACRPGLIHSLVRKDGQELLQAASHNPACPVPSFIFDRHALRRE